MTPPCRVFPASELQTEIQTTDAGKRRKGGRVDLSACELLALTQYDCQIDRPDLAESPVRCWPVQRWFRRCQDRKGTFMVETTMWEGRYTATSPSEPVDKQQQQQQQQQQQSTDINRLGDMRGGA